MTREDLIEKYVSAHAECRWMDAGDLDDLLHSFVKELDSLGLPESLEDAAWQYAEQEIKTWGSNEPDERKEIHDDFIAGAKWSRSRVFKYSIDELDVKEDAAGYPFVRLGTLELYDYSKNEPLAKKGDKVKVIVIPEEK